MKSILRMYQQICPHLEVAARWMPRSSAAIGKATNMGPENSLWFIR